PDVTVFSNCDEVRLTVAHTGKTFTYKKDTTRVGMPSPVITFKDVFDFMDDKNATRLGNSKEVFMLAEGLIDGKVVATYRREPGRRPSRVVLWLDNEDVSLRADGSDMVTVVAGIADHKGNIKRLNNSFIKFHVEGEGRLVGDAEHFNNPRPVVWGTAPILVRSTNKAGKIKVTAEVMFEGQQMPAGGELIFESVPAEHEQIFDAAELEKMGAQITEQPQQRVIQKDDLQKQVEQLQRELNNYKLKEVEKQQTEFGEKN
ncbi:MAG: glycoside hydrolase family 2 protein, partial [Bacteroidales bacterium]